MLTTLNVTPPPDMPCERIVAKPPASPTEAPEKPAFPWGVQLIGDPSEIKALATYRALQKRHEAILGEYQPTIVARHGKLPPRRHEELPPPWITEERANERGPNHGKPIVE
jgi:hypothetical protein